MATNNVLDKSIVNSLEQMLLRVVIDSEFGSELLTNPEGFGIATEDAEHLVLPQSVAQQDMSFVELVNDATSFTPPGSSKCRCTCVSGFTIMCDGSSL